MKDRSNSEVCRAKCKLICNTCYVDDDVLNDVIVDGGLDPDATYDSADVAKIVQCAILVVKGWVETSRSEGGISTATDTEKVKQNIIFWCNRYGLDASELLSGSLSSIDNGSQLW